MDNVRNLLCDDCRREPYSSTSYDRIIPEHRTARQWIPEKKRPIITPPPGPSNVEKEESRKAVMRNLLRMGHSVEDVERLYGKF